MDVDEVALNLTEEVHFVEDHLFGVWQQLSMEREIVNASNVAREFSEHIKSRQEKKVRYAPNETEDSAEGGVIKGTVLYDPLCLV